MERLISTPGRFDGLQQPYGWSFQSTPLRPSLIRRFAAGSESHWLQGASRRFVSVLEKDLTKGNHSVRKKTGSKGLEIEYKGTSQTVFLGKTIRKAKVEIVQMNQYLLLYFIIKKSFKDWQSFKDLRTSGYL